MAMGAQEKAQFESEAGKNRAYCRRLISLLSHRQNGRPCAAEGCMSSATGCRPQRDWKKQQATAFQAGVEEQEVKRKSERG